MRATRVRATRLMRATRVMKTARIMSFARLIRAARVIRATRVLRLGLQVLGSRALGCLAFPCASALLCLAELPSAVMQ
jgi:hypothetical protein